VYEGLKNYFTVNGRISDFGQVMSGGLAGAMAWGRFLFVISFFFFIFHGSVRISRSLMLISYSVAIVYPLDVVKTLRQASSEFTSM
jgi:hypothetical protein